MNLLRKLVFWLLLLAFLFAGFWMVIVNNQPLTLNLLFTDVGPVNAGFVILVACVSGMLLGLLIGSSLTRLGQWRKQRQAASDDSAAPPTPPAPPPIY